jgi:hypothetical protein
MILAYLDRLYRLMLQRSNPLNNFWIFDALWINHILNHPALKSDTKLAVGANTPGVDISFCWYSDWETISTGNLCHEDFMSSVLFSPILREKADLNRLWSIVQLLFSQRMQMIMQSRILIDTKLPIKVRTKGKNWIRLSKDQSMITSNCYLLNRTR